MVKATATRALGATPIVEDFDLPGATTQGGAGPFLDYALDVRHLGGLASAGFDASKASNARYSGGFDVALLILMRPLGYVRPQDFSAITADPYLAAKLGAERLPDPSGVNRSLHRLAPESLRRKLRDLHRAVAAPALLADSSVDHTILDGDSTVEVVYGEHVQQARVGYNPRARGRRSYHPLVFTDGVRDIVLGSWLRAGDAGDRSDLLDHYFETRDWLASIGRPIAFARFDRGFAGEEMYATLEGDDVSYTIKTRITKRIEEAVEAAVFHEITDETAPLQIQAAEVTVKLSGWSRTRRVVIIRIRECHPDDGQLRLFTWGWRYEAIVTNLDWVPEDVWRFYNRRCQAENLIKELKEGYGIDKVSTGSFGANDADLVLKVISYNLMWGFRHDVLPAKWKPLRIRTLRTVLLHIPGNLVRHARGLRIRLARWFPAVALFSEIRARLDALLPLPLST